MSVSIGDGGQTVEVTAQSPLLGTEDDNIGQVVPKRVGYSYKGTVAAYKDNGLL